MKKTLIFFVVSCLFDCFSQHEHLLRDFGAKCFNEFDLQTGHVSPKGGVSELPKKREHVEGVKREFIISGCKIHQSIKLCKVHTQTAQNNELYNYVA